ncbi:MAG: hypothetical protein O7H41_16705, partial [Planctomycetota bacterium]|nr:hypothetical protein [Planctomycetota bacterium]
MTSRNSEEDRRTRKRRSLRFTVPLFFCLAAIAVAFTLVATIAFRAHRQHVAVVAIERLHGVVTYDYLYDSYESRRSLGRNHPEFKKIENILDRYPQSELDPDGRAWLRLLLGVDLLHDVARINLAY